MPLFTDCLRISSLKALRFPLQARVLTYNGPAQGEGRKKKSHDGGVEIALRGDEMDTAKKKTSVPAVP